MNEPTTEIVHTAANFIRTALREQDATNVYALCVQQQGQPYWHLVEALIGTLAVHYGREDALELYHISAESGHFTPWDELVDHLTILRACEASGSTF